MFLRIHVVYLEANFTRHSSQEGDTATFVIEHEFNSYAGELQFFFFSATESSPNITETSPNSTDWKPGSFSITTCRNDNRPLFYIEHYNWEWVFIERLPYSCDNKDDVEVLKCHLIIPTPPPPHTHTHAFAHTHTHIHKHTHTPSKGKHKL